MIQSIDTALDSLRGIQAVMLTITDDTKLHDRQQVILKNKLLTDERAGFVSAVMADGRFLIIFEDVVKGD